LTINSGTFITSNKNNIDAKHLNNVKVSSSENEWVDYDGMVYDVTVKNHILLVRRVLEDDDMKNTSSN